MGSLINFLAYATISGTVIFGCDLGIDNWQFWTILISVLIYGHSFNSR